MRLVVFDDHRIGVLDPDAGTVRDVTTAVPDLFDSWPRQRLNWLIRNWDSVADRLPAVADRQPARPLAELTLRAANPAPGQIVALPSNFATHLGEIGARTVTPAGKTARDIGFFLIAPSSVSGAGEPLELPADSTREFHHECELAVVIGRGGRDIARADALTHVFGYSCLVDATMRIVPGQAPEDRSLRKSFGSFTPIGPALVTRDEVPSLAGRQSRLDVNGEVRQKADLADMIVGVEEAIELISSVVALEPGDVIASGTPGGVGPVRAGDIVTIGIDGIGSMQLTVRERRQSAGRRW